MAIVLLRSLRDTALVAELKVAFADAIAGLPAVTVEETQQLQILGELSNDLRRVRLGLELVTEMEFPLVDS